MQEIKTEEVLSPLQANHLDTTMPPPPYTNGAKQHSRSSCPNGSGLLPELDTSPITRMTAHPTPLRRSCCSGNKESMESHQPKRISCHTTKLRWIWLTRYRYIIPVPNYIYLPGRLWFLAASHQPANMASGGFPARLIDQTHPCLLRRPTARLLGWARKSRMWLW